MNRTEKVSGPKGLAALVRSGLVAAVLLLGFAGPGHAATYFKIGLLGEPRDLNPFGASDAWTSKVASLMFQPRYMVDPSSQTLIPWLAQEEPLYDPKGKTVTFSLREMKWDDGSDFSAEDFVFTVDMIKRFRIPRYYAYWEFVEKVEAVDPLQGVEEGGLHPTGEKSPLFRSGQRDSRSKAGAFPGRGYV